MNRKEALILLSTVIFSMCSILYSLNISYFLTLLYGNTITIYSLTVGAYMLFLGVGAFLYNRFNRRYGMEMILYTEFLLIIIAFFAPLFISYISALQISYILKLITGFLVLCIIGVLSGIELPLLMGLDSKIMAKVIGVDYLGGLLGSLMYVFVFLPYANTIRIFHYIAFLNFVTVIFFYYLYKKEISEKINKKRFFGIIVTVIILFLFSNKVVKESQNYFLNKRIQLKVYL